MTRTIVAALLRLYPRAWRNEYGPELADMLLARPLTIGIVIDVIVNAVRQRVRAIEVPTRVGISLMVITIAALAWNIVAPPPYGYSWNRPTISERIELLQRPMDSEIYVLFLAGVGFWTGYRSLGRSGIAAVRVSVIASIPLVVTGVMMLFGMLDFVELHPGQMPTTFHERGIVYTFYALRQAYPAPLALLLSPLLRLPGAWLLGVVGGFVGRKVAESRRHAARA